MSQGVVFLVDYSYEEFRERFTEWFNSGDYKIISLSQIQYFEKYTYNDGHGPALCSTIVYEEE